jgi:hypothetical protein
MLVLCLRSLFKKDGFAIKPFSLLRDHCRDVSFVPLNHSISLGKGFRRPISNESYFRDTTLAIVFEQRAFCLVANPLEC